MPNFEENGSIREQADADLAHRGLPGVRGYLGIVIVILASTSLYHDAPAFTTTIVSGCLFQVALRLTLILAKKRIYPARPNLWRNSFYACLVSGASLLGIVSGFCIWRYGYEHRNTFFLGCCLIALSATSVNTLISNARVAVLYLSLSFAPGVVADIVRGGVAGYSLIGGTITLFLYLAGMAKQMNREYWQSLSAHRDLHLRTKELQVLALQDSLTGLPNRLHLRERVRDVTTATDSAGQSVGLLFIDLDKFKQVNDTFSHRIGDLYLIAVAKRMELELHPGEILARVGGDEFIVLIESLADTTIACDRARNILQCLKTPVVVEGHELPVSASVGLSFSPEHGSDLETLQKNADLAMYSAKRTGRGQFQVYSPQMSAKYGRAATIEKELRRALAGTGLALHYQPQFNNGGVVIGLEALARFTPDGLGPVSPGEFITVAEETGLIGALGRWVLLEACRQAVEWRNTGVPIHRIAVNVSAAQIIDENFVGEVKESLRTTGLDPGVLELELTESLFMNDLEEVAAHMNELRALGIRFSIDDFGAGYSSLSYLHKLPIDTVKIDRCFVNDLGTDSGNTAVIETILTLARSLQLNVIAEGVETSVQFAILQWLGCSEYQGYLFAKPLPPAEIPAALQKTDIVLRTEDSREALAATNLAQLALGLESEHSASETVSHKCVPKQPNSLSRR